MASNDRQLSESNAQQRNTNASNFNLLNGEDEKIRPILIALYPHLSHEYEQHMAWSMRWFFARFLVCIYALSATGGLVGFLFIRNPYCLLLIAAPQILLPAIYYLVPMHERMYRLRSLKIQAKVQMKFRKNDW